MRFLVHQWYKISKDRIKFFHLKTNMHHIIQHNRDRPIYWPTGISTFEDRSICEFEIYNDKRCPIISVTDIWLQISVSISFFLNRPISFFWNRYRYFTSNINIGLSVGLYDTRQYNICFTVRHLTLSYPQSIRLQRKENNIRRIKVSHLDQMSRTENKSWDINVLCNCESFKNYSKLYILNKLIISGLKQLEIPRKCVLLLCCINSSAIFLERYRFSPFMANLLPCLFNLIIMNIIAQIRWNFLNTETFRLFKLRGFNHFQSYSNRMILFEYYICILIRIYSIWIE